jgi:hypothetical protein
MSALTVQDLQRQARRLDRLNAAKERALTAMRNGAALHCRHGRGHTVWWLSTGKILPPGVGSAMVRDPRVAGVGDGLFEGEFSQTFRFVDDDNSTNRER